MSLTIDDHSGDLEEFEAAVNDEKTTERIKAAFEKEYKPSTKKISKTENDDVISAVVREIRKAKSLEEAKQVLIDNCVSLYHTETIACLVQYSMVEGPNPVYFDDDPRYGESFEDFATGEIGNGKDEYEALSEDEIFEKFSKQIFIHDGILEEVYTEKSGRMYTLDKDGNKIYKDQNFVNRHKSEIQKRMELEAKINRRKETVKGLLNKMDKLTPEVEAKISSCTTIEEIEEIYTLIKSTVPKKDDGMCDTIDLINSIIGIDPMTDAEKAEAIEDSEKRRKELQKLCDDQAKWIEHLQPYIEKANEQALADYKVKQAAGEDISWLEHVQPYIEAATKQAADDYGIQLLTPESYEEIKKSVRSRYIKPAPNNSDNK